MLYHVFFAAVFLLAVPSVTSSTTCSEIKADKCIQQCNGTNCACTGRDLDSIYTGCTQLCGRHPCREITCSAQHCIQSCHGCTMKCARGVEFCSQRCLSGKCSIACAARRCEQDCSKGDCRLIQTEYEEYSRPIFPKTYLMLLAGCFLLTTLLSLVALCLSCRTMKRRHKNATYQRLRSVPLTPPMQSRVIRDRTAIRHGAFEFSDSDVGGVHPDAIRISVLPLPEKPV